jgi:hypothetical protein
MARVLPLGASAAFTLVILASATTLHAREIIVATSGGEFTQINAALTAAVAGDVIRVRPGVYAQNVTIPKNGLTLQGDPGAILDGTGVGAVGVTIRNRSDTKIVGLTIRNYKGSGTPMGISVSGGGSRLELRDNFVHNIESPNGNAHGIAFYGDSATPLSQIKVEGNEISSCRLGQSESLVLNGNVDGFVVSRNVIHDNDNIGIDFIGFEGTGPDGQDQARNGVCTDNVVYNISSAANPTYGGERSADGIYVDGGRNITIERNRIDACDIGIEVASEHGGRTTSDILVRNNFVSRSFQGNIMSGGYASGRGSAANIQIYHNTTYQGGDGEVVLQYNNSGVTVKNNILVARFGTPYLVRSGSNNTNVFAENNLYFGASTSSPGAWPDARAKYVNPLLVSAPTNLHVTPGSPAIGVAIALGNDAAGSPLAGNSDIDGTARVQGVPDVGADEVGGGDQMPPRRPINLR